MTPLHNHSKNVSLHINSHNVQHVNEIEPGMTIVCRKGLVWLTEPSDLRDYTLRPGHHVVIRKRGQVLIEALADADVSIIYPN